MQDVIARWVHGWAAARCLPAPEDLGDGLSVLCRQPGRDVEIFARYADDDPASVARLANRVATAGETTWLTVPTTHPERIAFVLQDNGLILLKRNEQLMSADLRRQPRYDVPATYVLDIRSHACMVDVEVRDPRGGTAARGAVGLAGTDAVVDRVLTWPDHRRRGLANAVMSALADCAVQRGAGSGLLIGSEDGQRLYAALGWTAVADVLIAAPPGAAYPEE